MFDVCYYENYRNESRLQTEAGASPTFDPGPSHVIYRVWRQRATLWPPETTDPGPDTDRLQPEVTRVTLGGKSGDPGHQLQTGRLQSPAPSADCATLYAGTIISMIKINNSDISVLSLGDATPGCYVQSVLLWRCDPVVRGGAVIGCCRAECETWHLLPPRLIGQLAPAHRGLLLGSLIMMECQGLSRY